MKYEKKEESLGREVGGVACGVKDVGEESQECQVTWPAWRGAVRRKRKQVGK